MLAAWLIGCIAMNFGADIHVLLRINNYKNEAELQVGTVTKPPVTAVSAPYYSNMVEIIFEVQLILLLTVPMYSMLSYIYIWYRLSIKINLQPLVIYTTKKAVELSPKFQFLSG